MSPTMYFVKYCLIFLVASLLTLPLHAQELIFRSGFEPGSALVNQTSKTAQFTGVDQSVAPPNDWTKVKNHPSVGRLEIQYKDRDEKQQNKRRAEITSDPTGSGRGQVLKYWITGRNDTSNGRIQMNAYEGKEGFKEYYERFKIYLPSESFAPLKASSNSFDFLTIIEIWNNKNWDPDFGKPGAYPYRMNVNITKPSGVGKGLYLRAIGEQQSKGCCWGEGGDKKWEVTSEYPLPLDTWLDVEFYVKEGNATTGKLQMAVTPPSGTKQMLFDVTGWTRHPDDPKPDGIKYANPLKLYTSSTINTVVAAGDSLKLYWDDFELWKNKKIDFTPGPGGGANCSPTNWNNTSFVQPSGMLVAEWEAVPGANDMNGVVGLSDGEASAYDDLACIVRFNKEGNIDARNGSTYSANQTIAYEKDKAYRVRIEADLVDHTYDAYVTPEGGSEQTIGTDFAFRTEQSTTSQLNNYAINTESGCLQVDKFTATSPGSGNVTVRARGVVGSEQIEIRYNDQRVGERITLSTSFQEYKVQVNNANGNFKVAFVNDEGSRTVFVDWLAVGTTQREAESRAINTGAYANGKCGGGTLTERMACNGYIDFGTISQADPAGGIVIRAKGATGSERMSLMVDGETRQSWTVATAPDDYTYQGYSGGVIQISFDNDLFTETEDRNLAVNYIRVCGAKYESNGEGVVRDACGTDNDRGFAWLYCSGSFTFGNVGCNSNARTVATVATKTSEFDEPWAASFSTYPNPVSEQLTVQGGKNYRVTIYDMAGQVVLAFDHLEGKRQLNVGSVRPGLYLIKLQDDQQREVRQRIIVE